MNYDEMQSEVDAFAVLMSDKGLKQPAAEFQISSGCQPTIWLTNEEKNGALSRKYRSVTGDTLPEMFENARKMIADLPSMEEQHKQEFLRAMADLIDLGRENGISMDFMNPLTETMKLLSENIITDQRHAAA